MIRKLKKNLFSEKMKIAQVKKEENEAEFIATQIVSSRKLEITQ